MASIFSGTRISAFNGVAQMKKITFLIGVAVLLVAYTCDRPSKKVYGFIAGVPFNRVYDVSFQFSAIIDNDSIPIEGRPIDTMFSYYEIAHYYISPPHEHEKLEPYVGKTGYAHGTIANNGVEHTFFIDSFLVEDNMLVSYHLVIAKDTVEFYKSHVTSATEDNEIHGLIKKIPLEVIQIPDDTLYITKTKHLAR